jgi:putative aminopeptidase FrvX
MKKTNRAKPPVAIQEQDLLRFLTDLIHTPSPTGNTDAAVELVAREIAEIGFEPKRTRKGALVVTIPGSRDDAPRALSAHVDTLGAMVAEIKANGRLRLTALNGVLWPTVESEGVMVHTRDGRQIRGSMVLTDGAAHVNKEAASAARTADSLEVRLDERTFCAEDTNRLGITVGDFVSFDPRFEIGQAGYIRSRFLDDKACVACVIAALRGVVSVGAKPAQRTTVLVSNYEEVGHGGMDGLPDDLAELLVLDMAALGAGLQGDEHHCTVCVKDSSGPYSKRLVEKLRRLAEEYSIELRTDVYPHYASDGSAYWRSGGRAEVALIGPGVDTSHGYERTHIEALMDTATLAAAYLLAE